MRSQVVPTKKGGEEEQTESQKMMQQVKDAGVAGIISYIFWEWAFWGISVPVCIFAYQQATGHWCASPRHASPPLSPPLACALCALSLSLSRAPLSDGAACA